MLQTKDSPERSIDYIFLLESHFQSKDPQEEARKEDALKNQYCENKIL